MPIIPLPQFEEDLKAHLAEEDRKAYEALKVPTSMVVRFGSMKLVGEFPYVGTAKPGCGSKVVVRAWRGTELGEMLTSTCPNSGCSKSVSRQDMLRYIENSGGRDYPFFTEGRVLRIATKEDLDKQDAIEQSKHGLRLRAREIVERLRLSAKIVEIEPILGGESITVHYAAEDRVELRDLSRELTHMLKGRVDLHHVGARDEARLTADYEKCGQYCCCKNFLKVLSPVSMKSAKVQKATLDPLKISGRCGRLMCCLRYEDQTYEDLRKRLPRRKSRVGTPEGDGIVLDGQILTQLVLVELDEVGTDGKIRQVAVPVESLSPPGNAVAPVRAMPEDRREGRDTRDTRENRDTRPGNARPNREGPREPLRSDRPQGAPPSSAPPPPPPKAPAARAPTSGAPAPGNPRPPQRNDRGPRDQSRDQNRDQNRDQSRPPQRPDREMSGPIDNRPPRPARPPQPPRGQPGPQQSGPPRQSGPRPPAAPNSGPSQPRSADDEIDDLLGDIETDVGGHSPSSGGGPSGSQGSGGRQGGKRRRRRRGPGGGQGGQGGQGGPNSGGGGGPSAPSGGSGS
jgi:cell fate regulator YaaT (PSP1 superfamily)